MTKPKLKKTKNGKWMCYGDGTRIIQQATAQIAYLKWTVKRMNALAAEVSSLCDGVNALSDENIKLQQDLTAMTNQAEHRCELGKLTRDNNKWVVERINHYDQQCIDWIWQTKTLPSMDQYLKWTGRTL